MKIGILSSSHVEATRLRDLLARASEHEVIWQARDVTAAISSGRQALPDVLMMSVGAGEVIARDAVRRIMIDTPCAILLIAHSIDDHASVIFDALGAGAIDAIDLPRDPGATPVARKQLLAKLDIIRRLGQKHAHAVRAPMTNPIRPGKLVVIGASAGGPAALANVLSRLPAKLPAPVIIVQHLDKQFMKEMTAWLDLQSHLDVRIAMEGEPLTAGVVYLAGRNEHLVLRDRYSIGYEVEPSDHVYQPSIDELFHSVVRFWKDEVIGVLLTGMGSDGALGLLALREAGALTITQDQASSVVYGIPKAAARINAAVEILPLDAIGERIVQALATKPARKSNG